MRLVWKFLLNKKVLIVKISDWYFGLFSYNESYLHRHPNRRIGDSCHFAIAKRVFNSNKYLRVFFIIKFLRKLSYVEKKQ